MLKRLRRKIVILITSLVGIILVVSVLAGPLWLGVKINAAAGKVLHLSAEIGPTALSLPRIGRTPSQEGDALRDAASTLDDLAGSGYPVYCASVTTDGLVIASNADTVDIYPEVLSEALDRALESPSDSGRLTDLRIMYARVETDDGYNVAFLDTGAIDSNIESSIGDALFRVVVGLALLFGLAVLFARYVTRPVENAWSQQQRFVADASHELKTPLTVILASADIMRQHPEKTVGDQDTWLAAIEDEGKRMKKLVEELLAAARAGEEEESAAARKHEPAARVDVSELAEGSCLQFEAVAFDKGIDFDWSVAPGLACMGDTDSLERLVRILLDNAMKYAGPPGKARVELAAEHQGTRVVIGVRNSGDPIDPEVLPHLFDRFYRADSSRTDGSSFGLGLFIAQSIAHAHKGKISVTSTAEDGTRFTCSLPAA